MRTLWLTLCLFLGWTTVMLASDLPPEPTVGPVTLGMSIEEALKATPGITWEQTISPVTGQTLEIRGKNAWTLDGFSYTARFRLQAHR